MERDMLIIADPRDLRVQKLRGALFEHDIGVCDATGGEDASTVLLCITAHTPIAVLWKLMAANPNLRVLPAHFSGELPATLAGVKTADFQEGAWDKPLNAIVRAIHAFC